MNEAKYFMGVDTGTQSVRVVVTDISGNALVASEKPYKTFYPQPGRAEQKPEDWWSCFNEAVKEVTDRLSMGVRYSIEGISVCSTSSTVVPIDQNGTPLQDAIMWMDTRAIKEMEICNATNHPYLKYCGGAESVEWMIPKVLWIKRNQPDIYKKSYKIIEQLDWFNYKLTGGKLATSICQAACKWNYIDGHGGWQSDFFEQIGLEDYADILVTDVKQVGEPLGKISHEFAEKYDLNPDMLVIEGGIDAHIGMLGMGVSKPGRLAMIMGTSFVQLCFSKEQKELSGIWGPYINPVVPGLNILEGGQISAGSIVKWYMKEWGFDKMDHPYEAIADMLKDTKPGANGLVALDFFQGNRTPYKDPNAKGVIYGLTLSHTKADIYRSLIESVAMGTKNIIDNFEKQGEPIDMIVGCGGVTKDSNWMQIIADATGKPIIVTVDPSAGGLGCCIVASVGTGTYDSFDDATEGMVKMAYTVEPNPENYAAYEKVFKKYTELYDNLKNMMNDEE